MAALLLGLLVVFAVYQMSLFTLTLRVRDALATRHPEVWRSIWIGNLSFALGVFWFVFIRRGSTEGDKALSTSVRTYRYMTLGGIAVLATVLALLIASDIISDMAPHLRP